MKVSINQVKVPRVGINTACIQGVRLGSASKGGQTSPFHPSLVDYWNFKGKSNSDKDRNTIKGIKGEILTAYNFGWSLGSGYGLFKENYNNYRRFNGTRAIFTNKDSYIHITESLELTNFIETSNTQSVNAYSIKVSGVTSITGGISYGYFSKIDGFSELVITDDGVYNLPAGEAGFNGFRFINYVGPCDITIEQIPEHEGAIVTDGIDDYLKLDKVGYKIGTVIVKYVPISIHGGWNTVFDTYNDVYVDKCIMFYNNTLENWGSTMNRKIINDYSAFVSDTPKNVDVPLYLAARYENTVRDYLSMALYEMAIYSEILTAEEIQKEIKVMEYGTPNPVFALNFDNFAYKAVDYPDFATGKATTNKIVVDSTTESFTGVIAVAMNPEVTTGDAIEVPAYKLKISGFNDYNLPESSFGVAILASNISGGSEYIAETPALDGVYDVPSIALSDGIFNLAIVTQIAIDKPIEIEILYDKNVTKSFPETKQIFP